MDLEQLIEQARRAAPALGSLAQSLAGMLRPIAGRLGAAGAVLASGFRLYLDTEEAKAMMQGLARTRADAGDGTSPAPPPPDAS
jgi:hypothetical protein